jgi:hypothetical protein
MNKLRLLIGILVFGSLWGFLEATLGGFLHFIHLPQKGIIMASIAVGIMSMTRVMYRRPGMQLAMGIITVALKSSNALFLGADVVRPMIAILMQAVVFDVAVTFLSKINTKDYMKAVAGAITGWGSTAGFALIMAYVLKIGFWTKIGLSGILSYLASEGLFIAIGCAIAAVLGSRLYYITKIRLPSVYSLKSRIYYSFSAAFASTFWVLGVFIVFA